MAITFQSIYRSMDEALKLDDDNKNQDAYIQYLKSVTAAASYLLQESRAYDDRSLSSSLEMRKSIKLIKMCVQRVETLLDQRDQSNAVANDQDLPPSYLDVTKDLKTTAATAEDISVPSVTSDRNTNHDDGVDTYEETDSWSEVPTDESVSSAHADDVDSSPSSVLGHLSLRNRSDEVPAVSHSKITEPSPMEIAIKKNKMLVRRYQNRLGNIKQPSSRVHAVLELQRRLVDNLKAAEMEQRMVKESHKRRQLEMIQKVRRRLRDVIQNSSESMNIDPRVKDLCRRCIHYEQEQEQTWPNDLRDCLSVDVNAILVSYIAQETLNTADYPLAKWLQNRQKDINSRLNLLLQPHGNVLRQISHPNFCESSLSSPEIQPQVRENPFIPELNSQLQNIIDDINGVIEVATEVMLLIYLDIEKLPDGKNICSTAVEEYLFKVIWNPLCRLYRLTYHQEEVTVRQVMNKCKADPVGTLGLERVIYPELNEMSIKATSHLKEIVRLSCPSHKVDKLVQVFVLLSEQITTNTDKTLGADELIPLLTYVFVMCDTTELIPEFYSMQNFMSESDMYGQKGYCISSMQTVLAYILTLNVPEDMPEADT